MDKTILQYIVVYKSKNSGESLGLTIDLNKINREHLKTQLNNSHHLLDLELINSIPAFSYILHLPRTAFDLIQNDPDLIDANYDNGHFIFPIPSSIAKTVEAKVNFAKTALIIYEKGCENEASILEQQLNPLLKNICINEINTSLLKEHWNQLKIKVKNEIFPLDKVLESSFESYKLLPLDKLHLLSSMYFLTQFDNQEFYMNLIKAKDGLSNYLNTIAHHSTLIKTLVQVKNKNQPQNENKKLFEKHLSNFQPKVILSLTLGSHVQNKIYTKSKELPSHENDLIKVLSSHRGIAKNAIVFNKNMENYSLFEKIRNLEDHCKKTQKKNKYIWNTLKEIGKEISLLFTEEEKNILNRASEITIFSDFPVGIGIFPNNTSPLNCSKSISYKPLTPLTKALEYEFSELGQCYMHTKINVLILECISDNDRIKSASTSSWKALIKIINGDSDLFNFIFVEVKSLKEFKNELNKNIEAHILIISAHGIDSKKNNCTAICIGDSDYLFPNEKGLNLPPIVLLSCCHTSQRGNGYVTIADSLLANGAKVVLSSMIPIDVKRNISIFIRLLVNISITLDKKELKNLSEIWSYVTATQAIEEILSTSEKLKKWAYNDKTFPINKFKLDYTNRLRSQNIYEDSISLIKEIAAAEGMEELVDTVIKNQGVFPESIFYQLIGYPENIRFGNPYDLIKQN